MSGYQEVTIQVRKSHVEALQNIAEKEHGHADQVEKAIFTALLDYFESQSTNEMLEEAVREALGVLEDHVKVLLDLIKTLLISSSYDTSKIRLLLEFLFENEIGRDLIPELYKRTGESVIERLKEEQLGKTADIITENETMRRQLQDFHNKESSLDAKRQDEINKQKSREQDYAKAVQRLTSRADELEQQQKRMAAWVNGLVQTLSQQGGKVDPQTVLHSYTSKNPKPDGIL